jgi:hypothetical protein
MSEKIVYAFETVPFTIGIEEGRAIERAARKRRKPSLNRAIKAAEKSGKPVSSVTLRPDGSVALAFGPPEPSEVNAPRDASAVASDRIVELRKRRG